MYAISNLWMNFRLNTNINLSLQLFNNAWMYYKIRVNTGVICVMMCPSVAVDFCYCYRALYNLRGFLLVQSRYQCSTCSHNDIAYIVLNLWYTETTYSLFTPWNRCKYIHWWVSCEIHNFPTLSINILILLTSGSPQRHSLFTWFLSCMFGLVV
jgi:hypothetical protein